MSAAARRLLIVGGVCSLLLVYRAHSLMPAAQDERHPTLRALAIVEAEEDPIVPKLDAEAASPPPLARVHADQNVPDGLVSYTEASSATTACDLIFAIPTVARDAADYLNLTLEALLCQMRPGIAAGGEVQKACIAVYEARPPALGSATTPFAKARALLRARTDVFFLSAPSTPNTSLLSAAERSGGAIGPAKSAATKRQTADVARMLLAVERLSHAHVILMEDDWLLCEGALDAIRYLLAKATIYQTDWAALRFSYGLNGILMHARDLPAMARFLLDPAADKENDLPDAPVDHLVYRWLRGKYSAGRAYFGRRHIMAYRHTLFWHIGDASAVGNSAKRHKPKCYGLTKEWLFDKESFHVEDCPDDDLWPCSQRPAPETAEAQQVQRIGDAAIARATGAARCGAARICWRQPANGRCLARLACPAERPNGAQRPCVPQPPEYEARS